MQTPNTLPPELKAVIATPRNRQKPIRLQAQVRKELNPLVANALASGITQTELVNIALRKLLVEEK